MRIGTAKFSLALVAVAFLAPAADGVSFSADNPSPTLGVVGTDGGAILVPTPPAPALGPLPVPSIFASGGAGGLGLSGIAEVDALSYGADVFTWKHVVWYFSVDRSASGLAAVPGPSVTTEGSLGAREASADVFKAAGVMPLIPPGPPGTNVGVLDGDGLVGASGFVYPGVGLNAEPNPGGDNLDALDYSDKGSPGPRYPIYFSVDPATAAANGFQPGDVLMTGSAGGPPALYAPAAQLGLDAAGAGTDDLDALVLIDDGDGVFSTTDFLLYSVTPGSAIVGTLDGLWNAPITPGDILIPSFGAGGVPGVPWILIAAEAIGLATTRAGSPASDNLDALDVIPEPATLVLLAAGGLALLKRRRKSR